MQYLPPLNLREDVGSGRLRDRGGVLCSILRDSHLYRRVFQLLQKIGLL